MDKIITVLLATYNSEKYISCQLESLLNQTFNDRISILISDDGSTDSTIDIIKEYIEKYPQISLIKSKTPLKSPQANFWFLLKNAPETKYYMFCDHDDFWLKDKIEQTYLKMQEIENDKPALIHTDLCVSDDSLNLIAPSMFDFQALNKDPDLKNILIQSSVTGCTMMINNALKNIALKKETSKNMIMHDWYLSILACAFGNIGFVNESLILYRQHGNNQVGAKNTRSVGYLFKKFAAVKKNKENIFLSYKQAKDIYEIFNDNSESFKLIKLYADNLNKNKLQRVHSAFKYGFWKNTFLRKLGQIIFM